MMQMKRRVNSLLIAYAVCTKLFLMPKTRRFFSCGFIDILSLVAVFFLVATIVTGVTVVNKENANFDLRNKAAGTCDQTIHLNTAGTCPDGKTIKYVHWAPNCTDMVTDTCTGSQNTPGCAAGAVMNTAGTCPDGKTIKYVRLNADCKTTTTDTCPDSPTTQDTSTTTQPETVTPPQTCNVAYVSDVGCGQAGCLNSELAQTWKAINCSEKVRCIPSTACNQTTTQTTTTTTQTVCNVSFLEDIGCGKSGCTNSELAQNWKAVDCSIKVRCVPSTACATTGSPVAPACTSGQKQCSGTILQTCSGGVWISQNCADGCTSGACNQPVQTNSTPTQAPDTSTITTPTLISCSTFGACYLNTYTCEKSYGQMDCPAGNICGTRCSKPISATTPVVTTQIQKQSGDTCDNDAECSSDSCKQKTNASPAKYCTDPDASLLATNNTLNTVTFTYNTLNALTFGTFGNYVQTNQDIYASNPEASYFERAFNLQNLSASAKLGAVLVAEGAILVAAAPYAVPILTGANVVDDTVTIAQCMTGDQNACAMAVPTLLSPIPGTGLAGDIADFADSWDLLTPNRVPTVRTNLVEPVGNAGNLHPASAPDIQELSLGTVIDEPLSTSSRNILAYQMTGALPSETGNLLAQQARQLMGDEGLDQAAAITRLVNENTTYYSGSGSVPADAARSIEQSICLPGQCRNISQISTTVANNMGTNAEFSIFSVRNLMTGEVIGHAVTPFINAHQSYGIIDATNGVSFNTVDEYVNWLTSRGYTPATDIMGSINGSTIYQLPTNVQNLAVVDDLTTPTSVRDVPTTENLITPNAQVPSVTENLVISPQIAEDNADLILNPVKNREFVNVRMGESMGGNAGDGYSGVNAVIDNNGKIVSFGNIQDLAPEIKTKLNNGELKEISIQVKAFPQVEGPNYRIVYDTESIPKNIQDNLTLLEEQLNQSIPQATQSVTKPSFIGLEWKGLTNPDGQIQWPVGRVNAPSKIIQTPSPALSQFLNSDSIGSYEDYVESYGLPPSTIHTVRDPDKLLPFQNRIVQRSKAGEITPEFIVQELRKLKSQGVNIKIVSANTLLQDNTAGWARLGEAPTGGGLLGISPIRTAEITITDPAGYATIYGVSKDEGLLIMAQKVGHEGGHGVDWVKYNISENWASKVLSKEFNIKFYSTIGQQNAVAKYQELLDQISTNSKVVK
jgi:hypothetical protein